MPAELDGPCVLSVSQSAHHSFSKQAHASITLLAGYGVVGDAHGGATVQHRSRVRRDPNQPNLRQVHLLSGELHDELRERGFDVRPGQLGENITTSHLELLALSRATRLLVGASAVLEVTGLRNPCRQLDAFRPGLMAAVLGRDASDRLVRKAGIMAVVIAGGEVRPGDPIVVQRPAPDVQQPLTPV